MKNKNTKNFLVALVLITLISSFCLNGFFVSAKIENHGDCGENVRWYLDESTKTLNILGAGKMKDYVVSPWRNADITSVFVANGITAIGENAFADCKTIQSVQISEGVTEISSGAFAGCRGLKNISIPNSLNVLGGGVFDDCVLLNFNQYGNCFYLGNASNKYLILFSANNKAITSVTINTSTKIIGDSAFFECYKLTSVDIPEGVKRINDGAFAQCGGMTSVTVPTTIEYLGSYVFDGCTSLQGTSYLKGISYLKSKGGDYVVAYKSSTSVNDYKIASTARAIYDKLLFGRTNATSVTFASNTIYSVGRQAFEGCPYITELTFSNFCTRIGDHAFADCENLTSLKIYNGIERIENSAFMGCTELETITFGNGIKRIDNYAFSNLDALKTVNFVGRTEDFDNIKMGINNDKISDCVAFNKNFECLHTNTKQGETLEATCALAGHQPNTYCTTCGQITKYGDEIKIKEHTSYTWETVENSTKTNDGLAECYCSVCGKYEYKILPKTQKGIINISSVKGCKDGIVSVKVNLDENPGFISMALTLNYDRSVLELVSVNDGKILGSANHQTDVSADPFKLSWENDTLSKDISATGTIVTLVFKINSSATEGAKANVSLTYNFDNADIVSANLISREFVLNGGTVEVIKKVKGDTDSDGVFGQSDRTCISRYLAGWDGYEDLINLENADVNGDKVVNTKDRIIISRKLAGWTGYDGYFS